MQQIVRVDKGKECQTILSESKAHSGITYFAVTSKDDARNNGYQDVIPNDMDFSKETLLILKFK